MRSIVEVELTNGKVIKKLAENTRGTQEKTLTEQDVYEKFMECSSFAFSEWKADQLFTSLKEIEKIRDIRDLTVLFAD